MSMRTRSGCIVVAQLDGLLAGGGLGRRGRSPRRGRRRRGRRRGTAAGRRRSAPPRWPTAQPARSWRCPHRCRHRRLAALEREPCWPVTGGGVSHPLRPGRARTALTRRFTSGSSVRCSFEKIELMCFSTARSDRTSVLAIAAFDLPVRHLGEDLALARRQVVEGRATPCAAGGDQLLDHLRIDHRAARGDRADRRRARRRRRRPGPSAGRRGPRSPPRAARARSWARRTG